MEIFFLAVIAIAGWLFFSGKFKGQRNDYLEEIADHLNIEDAQTAFAASKELVIRQFADPINSGVTRKQAEEHLERCVAYLNQISKLEGKEHGPSFRFPTRIKLLKELQHEARTRKSSPTMVSKNQQELDIGSDVQRNTAFRKLIDQTDIDQNTLSNSFVDALFFAFTERLNRIQKTVNKFDIEKVTGPEIELVAMNYCVSALSYALSQEPSKKSGLSVDELRIYGQWGEVVVSVLEQHGIPHNFDLPLSEVGNNHDASHEHEDIASDNTSGKSSIIPDKNIDSSSDGDTAANENIETSSLDLDHLIDLDLLTFSYEKLAKQYWTEVCDDELDRYLFSSWISQFLQQWSDWSNEDGEDDSANSGVESNFDGDPLDLAKYLFSHSHELVELGDRYNVIGGKAVVLQSFFAAALHHGDKGYSLLQNIKADFEEIVGSASYRDLSDDDKFNYLPEMEEKSLFDAVQDIRGEYDGMIQEAEQKGDREKFLRLTEEKRWAEFDIIAMWDANKREK